MNSVQQTENRVNWNSWRVTAIHGDMPPTEYVTIVRCGRRWHWQHVKPAGKLSTVSTQSYRTATDAATAAERVAPCFGLQCILPDAVQDRDGIVYRSNLQTVRKLAVEMSEVEAMDADLKALRNGSIKPLVTLTDEDLEAADDEQLRTDWRG